MKTARVTAFPDPGTYKYGNTHCDLRTATDGAVIHFTTDGSEATVDSPVYRREEGFISIPSNTKDYETCVTELLIRAVAVKDGFEVSEESRFCYRIEHRPRTSYRYSVMRKEPGKAAIYCITDFDYDRMFLLVGTKSALLIDAGYDDKGDLAGLVKEIIGERPLSCAILHGHPDHVAQANRLYEAGISIFMSSKDDSLTKKFHYDMPPYTDLQDGMEFDLGDGIVRIYEVPGHTPGCCVAVLLDNGWTFSSDALGNNRPEVADTGWLQFGNPESTMDRYLASIQYFRARTEGMLSRIYTGHGTHALDAELYLDSLEKAVQKAVNYGNRALVPSLRPASECFGSAKVSIEGDYSVDEHWAGVNIGKLFTEGLNEKNNTLLSLAYFRNAVCSPTFDPFVHSYEVRVIGENVPECKLVASSELAELKVNGITMEKPAVIEVVEDFTVTIISPDGNTTGEYHFAIR